MKRINGFVFLIFLAVCFIESFTASAEEKKQKITYSSSFSCPPYRQVTENGEYAGFEVDVTRLIFQDSPYELEYHDLLWTGSLSEAFEGTGADCFGWRVITEESEKLSLLSEPFYRFEFCAYVLDKNYKEIGTLDDLRGLRVAVRGNTHPQLLLEENGIPFLTMPYGEDLTRALVGGTVDVVLSERRNMEYFLSRLTHMGTVSIHENISYEYPVGLAFNPDRPDLKEYADKRIGEIKKSGELEALYYKHFGRHSPEFIDMESQRKQNIFISAILIVAGLSAVAVLIMFLTAERRRKQKNRMSEERYNLLLNESEIILLDFDSSRRVLAYSESTLKLLDMPGNLSNFHSNFRGCIHPEDMPNYAAHVDKMYLGKGDSFISELRLRTTSKDYEYFLAKTRAFQGDDEKPRVCGIFININETRLLQSQMENTLNYDKLTGAMNRGKFISECDKIILENKNNRLALIFMDVDHLAKINNICGYSTGDSVLVQVAETVFSCISGDSCVFGRIGNDDFALLMPAAGTSEVEELFSRISGETAKISVGLETRIPIRIHGGFAFLEDGDSILSLLTKASAAQSVAMKRGATLVDYEQDVKFLTLDRDELSSDIIKAYENGDFEICYQPKVNVKTKKLVGMEALLRWNHPEKGEIPPSVFIELAEQIGFISTLDIWVITQACKQNKIWQDKGFQHVRVSANVSKDFFRHGDLVKSINEILEQTGMDSHYLDLELTESIAVFNPDDTADKLNQLRKTGVTVSMDDFGSGYASLGTLKMLPFDTLKIDRSLIADVDKNRTSQQIIKAIVDISKPLMLDIVAEGAETILQVNRLEELNCNVIQGFYFGKPVLADEFEENFVKY